MAGRTAGLLSHLRMLSGTDDLGPYYGNSHNQVTSRVGYCPQSDALLEYMTGREIMTMYARLWGVSEPQIQLYVNKWLKSLQLEPHADKIINTYR